MSPGARRHVPLGKPFRIFDNPRLAAIAIRPGRPIYREEERRMKSKKVLGFISAIFFLLCLQGLAFGQSFRTTAELQQLINMKNAAWQAGETSMTRLSPDERQRRLGFIRPVLTGKEPMLTMSSLTAIAAPASLDWRNYNGGNYVTPVRDQGGAEAAGPSPPRPPWNRTF